MVKLLGMLIILGSSVAAGSIPVLDMKNRIKLLVQLLRDLERMQVELRTNLLSVPELVECIYKQGNLATTQMYEMVLKQLNSQGAAAFSNYWSAAVIECLTPLTADEQKQFCALGDVLGSYALEDELAVIEQTMLCLQNGLNETRAKLNETGKLSISLATAAGLFFVIALV